MEKTMKFNELVKDIHDNAKAKGWYDGEVRHPLEMHMLMVSEIAEASEEVRSKRPPVYGLLGGQHIIILDPQNPVFPEQVTETIKSEGEAVELADCAIRIMDYFGCMFWDFDSYYTSIYNDGASWASDENKSLIAHMFIVNHISQASIAVLRGMSSNGYTEPQELMYAFSRIHNYFNSKKWDFMKVLTLKHEYNKTRPYRHGNKAL
jgi:hypothetical protein